MIALIPFAMIALLMVILYAAGETKRDAQRRAHDAEMDRLERKILSLEADVRRPSGRSL